MAPRSGNVVARNFALRPIPQQCVRKWKTADAQKQFPALDSNGYNWKTAVDYGLLFNF